MNDREDFKKLFEELSTQDSAVITFASLPITIRVVDEKLALATPVYEGGNYIPQSVRRCIQSKAPKPSYIKTFLNVDEGRFQISLNYLGQMNNVTGNQFRHLIEEFSDLAGEWRHYLDEHDKNDLVHVRVT